ncbi:MAG: amidase [Rhodospirillaceae bacterium]|jgi:aspartyl-tRNA(Asn)/glutamyl-tRNA(Gln) amidotransferase subunit A|nr:amidase [Rhodospirillaceae bacterium]
MNDLVRKPMTELSKAYRERLLSPVEVVDAYLGNIEALEPKLGAYQTVYADDARAAAEGAAKAFRSGHRIGPFHGLPFALKDIVDLEGRVTTGGSAVFRDRISPVTATIAKRLIAAGGILLGKTKTVEVAMGGWGTNQHMGTPWNPWDLDVPRTPGGSSAGSGVSVAACMAGCAVGTDTGGSVRLPAAWCGIVGLKVTEGRLPTDGIIPLSHTLDTPGPMTRTVADTVLMFETMDGRHPSDTDNDLTHRDGLFGELDKGVAGLRFGCLSPEERQGVDLDILEIYDAALDQLRGLGAEIVPFAPPMAFEDMQDQAGVISASEGYFHHGERYEDLSLPLDEDVRPRVLAGRDIKARDYVAALVCRQGDRARFLEKMRGLSCVLTPTIATAPVPLAKIDQSSTPARFTRAANYLGMCGLSVPMGLTGENLPASLQIMAQGGDEATAIRIGGAFSGATESIGFPIR